MSPKQPMLAAAAGTTGHARPCRERVVIAVQDAMDRATAVRDLYAPLADAVHGTVDEQLASLPEETDLAQCESKLTFFEDCKAQLSTTTASQVRPAPHTGSVLPACGQEQARCCPCAGSRAPAVSASHCWGDRDSTIWMRAPQCLQRARDAHADGVCRCSRAW